MLWIYVLWHWCLAIHRPGLSAFTAAFGTSANSATASKMESCDARSESCKSCESCPCVNFFGKRFSELLDSSGAEESQYIGDFQNFIPQTENASQNSPYGRSALNNTIPQLLLLSKSKALHASEVFFGFKSCGIWGYFSAFCSTLCSLNLSPSFPTTVSLAFFMLQAQRRRWFRSTGTWAQDATSLPRKHGSPCQHNPLRKGEEAKPIERWSVCLVLQEWNISQKCFLSIYDSIVASQHLPPTWVLHPYREVG